MQNSYRRTPKRKFDFSNVAQFIETMLFYNLALLFLLFNPTLIKVNFSFYYPTWDWFSEVQSSSLLKFALVRKNFIKQLHPYRNCGMKILTIKIEVGSEMLRTPRKNNKNHVAQFCVQQVLFPSNNSMFYSLITRIAQCMTLLMS